MDKQERGTVYLDVDDDITSIIGKLNQSEHAQVALVVPKRSSVLQSVVNMKLIKKAARENNKEPILISDDPIINKIAAAQGMLIAPNLGATPDVPTIEKMTPTTLPSDVIEGSLGPIATKAAAAAPSDKTPLPIMPDSAAAPPKEPKTPKKRLPDFDRFKKRFVLALLGLVGGVGLIWLLFFSLPRATIIVEGRTEPLALNFGFAADAEVENPQYNNSLVPAIQQEISKTLSKSITPTGTKDVGTKASGEITIRNCDNGSGFSMSPGSKFTSESGKVFVSTEGASVPKFTGNSSECTQDGDSAGTATVEVRAAANGESYNIDSQAYAFAFSSPKIDAVGGEMSGGTSKTIKVVTQGDVNAARKELLSNERSDAEAELRKKFSEDEVVVEAAFIEKVTKSESQPAVGSEADSARVSLEVEYTQAGIKKEYLEELIKREGGRKTSGADADSLAIVETGIDGIELDLKDKTSATSYRFSAKTQALLGPNINFDELKAKIARKKSGEAAEIVKTYPNVSGAQVKLSPFWVRKVPKAADKISIEIKLPSEQ